TKVQADLKEKEKALTKAQADLEEKEEALTKAQADLKEKEEALTKAQADLEEKEEALTKVQADLKEKEKALIAALEAQGEELTQLKQALAAAQADLKAKEAAKKEVLIKAIKEMVNTFEELEKEFLAEVEKKEVLIKAIKEMADTFAKEAFKSLAVSQEAQDIPNKYTQAAAMLNKDSDLYKEFSTTLTELTNVIKEAQESASDKLESIIESAKKVQSKFEDTIHQAKKAKSKVSTQFIQSVIGKLELVLASQLKKYKESHEAYCQYKEIIYQYNSGVEAYKKQLQAMQSNTETPDVEAEFLEATQSNTKKLYPEAALIVVQFIEKEINQNVAGINQNVAGINQNVAEIDQNVAEIDQNVAEIDQNVVEAKLYANSVGLFRDFLLYHGGLSKREFQKVDNALLDKECDFENCAESLEKLKALKLKKLKEEFNSYKGKFEVLAGELQSIQQAKSEMLKEESQIELQSEPRVPSEDKVEQDQVAKTGPKAASSTSAGAKTGTEDAKVKAGQPTQTTGGQGVKEVGVKRDVKATQQLSSLEKRITRASPGVQAAYKSAREWLGEGTKTITNKVGDLILVSQDGLRKMRFDINNPYSSAPHIHLQSFRNGKWRDAISGKNHIYTKK
ncbi:MAG: hypothetical protein MI674_05005, partial [Cytophagales bacterium]|nr:hypothetical protein [Cytophagales bacterium]